MNLSQLVLCFQNMERGGRTQEQALTSIFMEEEIGENYASILVGQKSMQKLRSLETRKLPNAFDASEHYFRVCYNLDKKFVEDFLIYICVRTYYKPELDKHRIPYDIRMLATLSFLVHGHMEYVMHLDAFKIYSKYALLRCVPKVCETIVYFLAPAFISFSNDFYELKKHKSAFLSEFNIPGVIGVMDCFLVRLSNIQEENRKMYTCRQGYTAVKVQVICDHNMRFMDVNPRYPGGTGDIYIWNHSHIRHMVQHLYENDKKTWIVADRGYRLEPFLINPYRNAVTHLQNNFNLTLKKVHTVLDKAIEILRTRFSCLNTVLAYNHKDCTNIVTACITLHNYMIAKGRTVPVNFKYNVSKKDLPNARHEDDKNEGIVNREFINKFIHNKNKICKSTVENSCND